MARSGKCTNYASCGLAFQNADIETEGDFVCPKCGQPLREIQPAGLLSVSPAKIRIYGGIAAGVLVFAIISFVILKMVHHHRSTPVVSETAASTPVPDTPAPSPETPAPVVAAVETPRPETPPKRKPPEPVATPNPETPAPPSPTVTREPVEEMPVATAVIDRNPQSAENRDMRAEVLKRIDLMPNLKPHERTELYAAVQKAKEMMKVITIPFATGQKTITPQAAEKLCEASHAPQVQNLAKAPTVVFVILGFADTAGSAESGMKLSAIRADSVAESLQDRCKLINRIQSVAMGSSQFFGSGKKEKNRVVEVWLVIP